MGRFSGSFALIRQYKGAEATHRYSSGGSPQVEEPPEVTVSVTGSCASHSIVHGAEVKAIVREWLECAVLQLSPAGVCCHGDHWQLAQVRATPKPGGESGRCI